MSTLETIAVPTWAVELLLLPAPYDSSVATRVARLGDCAGLFFELECGRWQFSYGTDDGYAALLDHKGTEVELGRDWRWHLRQLRELLNDPRMAALLDGAVMPEAPPAARDAAA